MILNNTLKLLKKQIVKNFFVNLKNNSTFASSKKKGSPETSQLGSIKPASLIYTTGTHNGKHFAFFGYILFPFFTMNFLNTSLYSTPFTNFVVFDAML